MIGNTQYKAVVNTSFNDKNCLQDSIIFTHSLLGKVHLVFSALVDNFDGLFLNISI